MPGVPEQRRPRRARSALRPRSAELSPELNEFVKMLKALEDRPDSVVAAADEPAS